MAAFDVPPIIATLGTLFFYRGLCEAVLKGTKPSPFFDVPGLRPARRIARRLPWSEPC